MPIFWDIIPFCLYIPVRYYKLLVLYDSSVLSMSVMGSQKIDTVCIGQWVDVWDELYLVFFWNLLNFAKPLN